MGTCRRRFFGIWVIGVICAATLGLSACGSSKDEPADTSKVAYYFGEAPGDVFVGLVTKGPTAMLYFCDGRTFSRWFKGGRSNGRLALISVNGPSLVGTISKDEAELRLDRPMGGPGGPIEVVSLRRTQKPSLYRFSGDVNGLNVLSGWVISPDGKQKGANEIDRSVTPASELTLLPGDGTAGGTAEVVGETVEVPVAQSPTPIDLPPLETVPPSTELPATEAPTAVPTSSETSAPAGADQPAASPDATALPDASRAVADVSVVSVAAGEAPATVAADASTTVPSAAGAISVPPPVESTTPTATTPAAAPEGGRALSLAPLSGPLGLAPTATGRGFEPGSVVELVWDPGIGGAQATVQPDGTFSVPVPVVQTDVPGPRDLIVRNEPNVRVAYNAEPSNAQPAGQGRSVRVR